MLAKVNQRTQLRYKEWDIWTDHVHLRKSMIQVTFGMTEMEWKILLSISEEAAPETMMRNQGVTCDLGFVL